jgi:hypothetical protein
MDEAEIRRSLLKTWALGAVGECMYAVTCFFQPWKSVAEIIAQLKEARALIRSLREVPAPVVSQVQGIDG